MTPTIEDRLREIAFGPNKCASDAPNHILRNAAREIERLRTALAEQARLNGMGSEREARLMARVAELTTLLDQQLGTPCEQIRHEQAEAEAYRRGVEDAAKMAELARALRPFAQAAEGLSDAVPDGCGIWARETTPKHMHVIHACDLRAAAAAIRSLTAPDKEGAP